MICRTLGKFFHGNGSCRLEETCTRMVRFCNSQSLRDGICVHSPIVKLGLEENLYLTNNLLSLYMKCDELKQALQLFDEMPRRDIVSWTSLIAGQGRVGNHERALKLFGSMMASGVSPNEFALSSVLQSCSALGEVLCATCIHAHVLKHGFQSNQVLGSTLIGLYSKWSGTEENVKLFEDIENGDTVSWTAMISSLVEHEKRSQALTLYPRMIKDGVAPNEFTFVKLLRACSGVGLNCGMMLHGQLIRQEIQMNVILKTALVNMYSRSQAMEKAIKVLTLTPEYDIFLWTAIVSGFVQTSKIGEAINAFHEMEVSGIAANNFTYSSLLSGCSSILSVELGQQLHSRVIVVGLENDVCVGNALIDMYLKSCGSTDKAVEVFRDIDSPNVISWTSLIAGLAEHSHMIESIQLFLDMRAAAVQPNSFTLSSLIKACDRTQSPCETTQLHGYIIKTKAENDIVVGNALVDAYAGLNLFHDAWSVIRGMDRRDAITYTSLATKMNHAGSHKMALDLIRVMVIDDIKMDEYSLACFLSATACLNKIETGRQLHCYSLKSGVLRWVSVSNGLVGLYGKCKLTPEAVKAFKDISAPDLVSWNTLISQLALNGFVSYALSAYEDMKITGLQPDAVTFLSILIACSRGNLADLAVEHFHAFQAVHNIEPQLNHYTCLVDLLGRVGRLEEARDIIETMTLTPDAGIYRTLLTACTVHKNVHLGEDMARKGLEHKPSDPTFYKLLANLYDSSGQYDLGDKAREAMRRTRMWRNSFLQQGVCNAELVLVAESK